MTGAWEMEKSELISAREEINAIDSEMAELFRRRMSAARVIAEYKKTHGLPVRDAKREEALIARNTSFFCTDPLEVAAGYDEFLRKTIEISCKYQEKLLSGVRVAYSGTEGAFAHVAAGKVFPYAERVGYADFASAYAAVVDGECESAVLPIENSSAGEVGQVNDLIFSGNLYISGTYDLAVRQDLLTLPGARLAEIREVVSHPQALGQCAEYIRRRGFLTREFSNTARAAEYVASLRDPHIAAIAGEEAAKKYGLEIAAENINESDSNTTKFAVLTPVRTAYSEGTGGVRFVLMFTVRNEAGSLARAIGIVGRYGFNMLSLRSRPMKDLLWQYYFYVEAEGNPDTDNGRAMIRELGECCDKLKLAGVFAKGNAT